MKKTKTPHFNVRKELIKLECRDCGADLEMVDDTYAHCKYCGQKYIVNVLLERIPDASLSKSVQQPIVEVAEKKSNWVDVLKGHLSIQLLLGVVSTILFLVGAVVFGVIHSANQATHSPNKQDSPQNKIYDTSSSKETEEEETKDWEGFRSQTMQQVVYQIFEKNVEEVTEEELASIRYFKMDSDWPDDTYTITYSMADYHDYQPDYHDMLPDYNGYIDFAYSQEFTDTFQTVTVSAMGDEREYLYGDIANFININALNLDRYEYVDYSKLPELTLLDSERTDIPRLIAAGLPVERIEVLKVEGGDLSGIEKFTGLKQLYLKYAKAEYIDDVAKCTWLENLYCIDCFDGSSYNPLNTLTGLKTFYVRGVGTTIKDLSVVASFKNLENLSIYETDILNIRFVKELKNLKTLRLTENRELKDFTGVGNLQNLEGMVIESNSVSRDDPLFTDMGTLKKLKTLILSGPDNLDFLDKLPQLEKVELYHSWESDLMLHLANLKNLKELRLERCNTYHWDYDTIDNLKSLPQLKVLTISGMEFRKEANGIFTLEALEELHLNNCTFEKPPKEVVFGDKLRILDLRGTDFKGLYYSEECIGYEEKSVSQGVINAYSEADSLEEIYLDHCEVKSLYRICQLPNLKVLSLKSCELTDWYGDALGNATSLEILCLAYNDITDIDFTGKMINLQRLDIMDCYVTDLSPLLNCPKLRYVDARENPIAENPLVNVKVVY